MHAKSGAFSHKNCHLQAISYSFEGFFQFKCSREAYEQHRAASSIAGTFHKAKP